MASKPPDRVQQSRDRHVSSVANSCRCTTTLAGTLLLFTLFQTPERLQGRSCPPPAEQLSPAMFQSGSTTAQDRGFLWRISKRGHTSYLYGTMHIAKQGWMFPGRTVRAAFDASDLLAVEVDSLDPN